MLITVKRKIIISDIHKCPIMHNEEPNNLVN